MPGNARLMDAHFFDEFVDLPFTEPQRLDHPSTGWVSQKLEGVYMHDCVYAYRRMKFNMELKALGPSITA